MVCIHSARIPAWKTFEAWIDRRTGFLTFRLTQFLTGHGCFGSFLHRIQREETPVCRYCDSEINTTEHTLAVCNYWSLERGELTAMVGQDLSLATLVAAMCASRKAWNAFSLFAEHVLRRKEEDERRRQQELLDGNAARRVS
ncbi:uncharacterized protein [Temnothorax longispinosus]|uniref:uncharacterized protein n=1 Tax=Temnothorax longispinosus TaxID=300112 RepID=UPI003A9A0C6A